MLKTSSTIIILKNNISFIIPCYNCADTIDECIQSVINTNLQDNDEIILVDDSSTDNTNSRLLYYKEKYDFVKLLKHNINKGTAAAGRNTGIDQAENELIFCLDSDNVLKDYSIKPLKHFLLDNDLDAAAFGEIEFFSESVLKVTSKWILDKELNFVDALNQPMKTPCGSGNFLYKKSIWKRVGRYNESLGGAYDSEIFGLRLLAEGAKFRTLTGTSYLHRNGYESTFIRDYEKRNSSLLFLAGLIEYWDQIHEDDLDYIFCTARRKWMDDIEHRPLRRKDAIVKKSLYKKILRKVANKISRL